MRDGEDAFTGETVTDAVAAILKEEPDWDLPLRIGSSVDIISQKNSALLSRNFGEKLVEQIGQRGGIPVDVAYDDDSHRSLPRAQSAELNERTRGNRPETTRAIRLIDDQWRSSITPEFPTGASKPDVQHCLHLSPMHRAGRLLRTGPMDSVA